MTVVSADDVPRESSLYATLSKADFHDSYQAPLHDPALTPAEIFLKASRATPAWVGQAMTVRNFLVRQIGLKDVGSFGPDVAKDAASYKAGERMGIFTVLANTERELLLGIDDSHLDVRVSVTKVSSVSGAGYAVSTAVYIKNLLGRLYMLPVGQIHPLVVRAMMRRANV